ncbi:alpha/beta-gliadin clone PW1215-like [Helianthus annuus]|uniref:alpha/beta-gliadin clone PW1215-like n=1 Tax=Helianthus annuus TaxID=4232 RepID=UPI001652CD19|nr:alpha/beta-gliadin clone PW1215-like [Helianthus annuus]
MEIEANPENQIPMPAFDPAEIPKVPAPHPPDYDTWFDDHRDYEQRYPIPDEPMQNLVGPYPDLDPLDPYYDNDQYSREILENPYPYEEPMPQFPDPIPAPAPPMSTENVQELRTFSEEILEGSEIMRQIGERLVWKYDERNM